jgi:lysophospholipase L1-like esterase
MNRLILLGDSTCAIKTPEARPETGWGEKIYLFMKPEWTVLNYAKNGRSTRSCLKEGIFREALMNAQEGDRAVIQFGHNDQKTDERGTDAFTTYIANLKYMASSLMEKGVKVIFITSVPRHRFVDGKIVDTHRDYIAAMKTAGHQLGIPVLDITIPLMIDEAMMGEEESRKYYMNFGPGLYPNYPDGKEDNTHLRPEGAKWVASEIASQMKKLDVDFLR